MTTLNQRLLAEMTTYTLLQNGLWVEYRLSEGVGLREQN
jgi:hypothetical protein